MRALRVASVRSVHSFHSFIFNVTAPLIAGDNVSNSWHALTGLPIRSINSPATLMLCQDCALSLIVEGELRLFLRLPRKQELQSWS
jgi:hypothetical protein